MSLNSKESIQMKLKGPLLSIFSTVIAFLGVFSPESIHATSACKTVYRLEEQQASSHFYALNRARSFGVHITELNGKLFELKAKADPRALQIEKELETYLQTAPIVRERTDIQIGAGYYKKIYELAGGGLIIFQRAPKNHEFQIWQAENEVLTYQSAKDLKLNRLALTVERTIDGETGSAQFFFTEKAQSLIKADDLDSRTVLQGFDWVINNGDRHDGNLIPPGIGIDHGWGFEPNGGNPNFIGHGDWRPMAPIWSSQATSIKEWARKLDLPSLKNWVRYLKAKKPEKVVQESKDRMTLLLMSARDKFSAFLDHQKPTVAGRMHFEKASLSGKLEAIEHNEIAELTLPSDRDFKLPVLRLNINSRFGAIIRVRAKNYNGTVIAVLRVPPNRSDWHSLEFKLPSIPLGTKKLFLEFVEDREMKNLILGGVRSAEIGTEFQSLVERYPLEFTADQIQIGGKITIGPKMYTVQKKLGEGDVGVAYRVTDESGKRFVFKLAKKEEAIEDLVYNEILRLSVYHRHGFAEYPYVRAQGRNFILKDYVEGTVGEDLLQNFDPMSPEHQLAAKKVVDLVVDAARNGVMISLRNPRNMIWNGQDWIIFDPSYRTTVSENPAALAREMARHLTETWQNPEVNKYLKDEDWFLRRILSEPVAP